MKLKQRIGDFRVRELLRPDYLSASGEHCVYRVTKRKLTSLEAAAALAEEVGVAAGDVAIAGLKDRQGITVQHMSVRAGRPFEHNTPDLRIETVGRAAEELTSADSLGNAFELVVRDLGQTELERLRKNLELVRSAGVVNYFDEQRFGNLRHDQGWIALQLLRGDVAGALRTLVAGISRHDPPHQQRFKQAWAERWGDWEACRSIALRSGMHRSVFEHLLLEPDDFAGAFTFVASRVRLIHLYAYQSHLWNRAVAAAVKGAVDAAERAVLSGIEGPLLFPLDPAPLVERLGATFRLPGPGFADVEHPLQRSLLAGALAEDGLAPEDFHIEGIPGFALKGEDRDLIVHPRHLRVRPPEDDPMHRGARCVKIRFELDRGAYATLVVRRLLARDPAPAPAEAGAGRPAREDAPGASSERSRGRRAEERGTERDRGRAAERPRGPQGAGAGGDWRADPSAFAGLDEPRRVAGSDWSAKPRSSSGSAGGTRSGGSERGSDRGPRWSDRPQGDRGGYRRGAQRDDRGGYGGGSSGGYRGGAQRDDRGAQGGYRGGSGGGYRGGSSGGYRGGWQGESRGGYHGGGQGESRGGYRGGAQRDDRGAQAGYRGGYQGGSSGGYRSGSQGESRGGYRGGGQGESRGGYRGGAQRDDRGAQGGYRGSSGGGYRGGSSGGYRGGSQGESRGGYRGGWQGESRGGYRGGAQRDDRGAQGGYRGSSGGGYRGGSSGGYRGGSQGESRGGYRGGGQGESRGGYRGGAQRDDRGAQGGYRGGSSGSGGGYRGDFGGRTGFDRGGKGGSGESRSQGGSAPPWSPRGRRSGGKDSDRPRGRAKDPNRGRGERGGGAAPREGGGAGPAGPAPQDS